MKKVGIITFHESDNYGTCLQAYAISSAISNLGYTAQIIPYVRSIKNIELKHSTTERIKYVFQNYGVTDIMLRNKIYAEQVKRTKLFSSFRNLYLPYGDGKYTTVRELENSNAIYDAYVCGSDMIWSPDRTDDLAVYFLQFAQKGKRVAYSPSFGCSSLEGYADIPFEKYISEIDYLSCRETSGIDILRNYTSSYATHTIDPTLLIEQAEWNNIAQKTYNHPDKYVLVYLFEGIPTWARKTIRNAAKYMNAEIVEIPMIPKHYAANIRRGIPAIGPEEFITLFQNAEMVFTNSYHGLMFSLLYKKPFYVIERNTTSSWGRYEDRLLSALRYFDCTNRYISKDTNFVADFDMDFDYVNTIINNSREMSLNYLGNSLQKATEIGARYE